MYYISKTDVALLKPTMCIKRKRISILCSLLSYQTSINWTFWFCWVTRSCYSRTKGKIIQAVPVSTCPGLVWLSLPTPALCWLTASAFCQVLNICLEDIYSLLADWRSDLQAISTWQEGKWPPRYLPCSQTSV